MFLQPRGELIQVAPIAVQRVARQAVFQPQAVAEFVEEVGVIHIALDTKAIRGKPVEP